MLCQLKKVCFPLLVTACLGTGSSRLAAQDTALGFIQYASAPQFNGAAAASGARPSGAVASEPRRLAATLVSNASPNWTQDNTATVPAPPAASGLRDLTEKSASPSDARNSVLPQTSDSVPALGGLQANNEANDKMFPTGGDGRPLTPLQTVGLSIEVKVVDVSVRELGILPRSAAAERTPESLETARLAAYKCVHWHPSSICHYPLRFEDTMLERHGHVRFGCFQPLVSGVKFLGTIPMIPYLATLRPGCDPVYALGDYRPGSCAPMVRDTLPWDRDAAVVEALSLAGFFWAMPL